MSATKDQNEKKDQKKDKSDLGALEEDDDFEEFPTEDWSKENESAEDLHAWEDNWDDDDVEDDFSQQLRVELERNGFVKK